MIQNARDQNLYAQSGSLPNMQDALMGWFQINTFVKIQKTLVDFVLTETRITYNYQGVKQPFTAQKLQTKPEGQRSWKWFTIHALPSLILITDEVIEIGTVRYRVYEKFDWKEYGYVEYHVVEDYQP